MGGKNSGNRTARGQIGHKGGTGRPPSKEGRKTVQFAGQRFTQEQVDRWAAYRNEHNLTVKQFQEQAFDLKSQE